MTNTALFVGINSYEWKPLNYAIADAQRLAAIVGREPFSFDTTCLVDDQATRPAILDELHKIMSASRGLRLIYFAGHAGIPNGETARFVSYGAAHFSEMVSFGDIATIVQAGSGSADGVLVILDCCQAGAFEIDTRVPTDRLKDAVTREVTRPNVAALLSTTLGSAARENATLGHGIFTYHLLQAFQGAGADEDGVLTASGVYGYCARKMEEYSYQKPMFKSELTGRAVIARSTSWASAANQERRRLGDAIIELEAVFESVTEELASLRPPFISRDDFRNRGWLEASKCVQRLAHKRNVVEQTFGSRCRESEDWRHLSGDILATIRTVSTPSIGTSTDLGRITDKIGEGGFGTVFKVEDETGNTYAYKIFHPHDLGNTAKEERFRIGYRAMDQLAHPRIVSVIKYLESPLSFHMDFVDGPNLRRWFGAELEPSEIVRIMIAITETVEYAHGKGVIHRDVKPENVILHWSPESARWDPILTDFDLAWFTNATSHTVEAFGAPFYAAPEQLSEPGRDVTHRETVDVYSLAMLMTYMITGRDPVLADVAAASVKELVDQWPSRQAADQTIEVLAHASARKPSQRLQTSTEFRSALLEIRSALIATGADDRTVSEEEFFTHLASTLDRYAEQLPNGWRLWSSSGRSEAVLSWSGRSLLLDVSKVDKFSAERTSHANARNALRRRIDRFLFDEAASSGGQFVGRRAGQSSSGGFGVRIEVVAPSATLPGARVVAQAVADLLTLFDQF